MKYLIGFAWGIYVSIIGLNLWVRFESGPLGVALIVGGLIMLTITVINLDF